MDFSKSKILYAVILVLRIALGAIFVYAGYVKLRDPWQLFAAGIASYEILPLWAVKITARVLPWFEVLIGLLLMAGRWFRLSTVSTSFLLLIFFSSMVRAFAQGKEINCGCFGNNEKLGTATLIRDSSLLVLALAVTIGAFLVKRRRAGISS